MAVKSKKIEVSELDRIVLWRFEELVALGLAPEEAITLIDIPDVVHAARNLAKRGCPLTLIAELLGE